MAGTRTKSRGRDTKGKFTDAPDLLPSLFADPDCRGSRRWREVFGHRRPEPPSGGGWLFRDRLKDNSSDEQ